MIVISQDKLVYPVLAKKTHCLSGLRQGLTNFFLVKDQIINIFAFAGSKLNLLNSAAVNTKLVSDDT